VLHIVHHSSDC